MNKKEISKKELVKITLKLLNKYKNLIDKLSNLIFTQSKDDLKEKWNELLENFRNCEEVDKYANIIIEIYTERGNK